ncbi:icmt-1, partial [Symbiodinium sp. CCMP2592]
VLSEDARADGYANFYAVSEWWTLKTAFTQWFTKNYTSVYQPLAAQMDISTHQHAVHSVLVPPMAECHTIMSILPVWRAPNREAPETGIMSISRLWGGPHRRIMSISGTARRCNNRQFWQVARRPSYKGAVDSVSSMPVDATTIPGMILVLGSILPSSTLSGDAVSECYKTLQTMEECMQINKKLYLIPGEEAYALEVCENHVRLSALKSVLKELELSWLAKKMPGNFVDRLPLSALLVCFFRLKGDHAFWGQLTFRRAVKRTLHFFSQRAEEALEKALVDECPCPQVGARWHPFTKSSRLKGNKALQLSVVSRFMSRGGGFISMKSEARLSDLGICNHRTALASKTAGEFCVRALSKAEKHIQQVLDKQEDTKVVNFCMDAASISHEQVLSLIFRMGGKHFSGATQLLNATSLNEEETEAAAASMAKAMDGSLPPTAKADVGKDKKLHFAWKEFRTPTKMLLSAMANSLQQSLPENWTLLSCKPANLLRPRGPNSERLRFTEKEKAVHGLNPEHGARYFVHSFEDAESVCDFYKHEGFYHLTFAADEGTEAGR